MKTTTATVLLCMAAAAAAKDLLSQLTPMDEDQPQLGEEDEDGPRFCLHRIEGVDEIMNRCYFKSTFYQGQARDVKLDQLWTRIFPEDQNSVAPRNYQWADFPTFFTENVNENFCIASDLINEKRNKVMHTQGLVAKVAWEPVESAVEAHGFTGVYKTGSDTVLMRLSTAQNLTEQSAGLTPGAAFKFMFDGIESENLMSMNKMTESDSWNFFEEQLKNRVPHFDPATHQVEIDTFQKKLMTANGRPFGTAVGIISDKNEDGSPLDAGVSAKAPYELRYISPHKDNFAYDASNDRDYQAATDTTAEVLPERLMWYDRVKQGLSAGDIVYEVHALTAPDSPEFNPQVVHIANVRLLTDLELSEEADKVLYFRHRDIMRDYDKYPSNAWRQFANSENQITRTPESMWSQEVPEGFWPATDEAARDEYVAQQLANSGCPFAWLLQ